MGARDLRGRNFFSSEGGVSESSHDDILNAGQTLGSDTLRFRLNPES